MVSSRDTAPDNQILALPSSALALWNRFDCVHALFACACGWVIRRRCEGAIAVANALQAAFPYVEREWTLQSLCGKGVGSLRHVAKCK